MLVEMVMRVAVSSKVKMTQALLVWFGLGLGSCTSGIGIGAMIGYVVIAVDRVVGCWMFVIW